jgi:hypothetical protein
MSIVPGSDEMSSLRRFGARALAVTPVGPRRTRFPNSHAGSQGFGAACADTREPFGAKPGRIPGGYAEVTLRISRKRGSVQLIRTPVRLPEGVAGLA